MALLSGDCNNEHLHTLRIKLKTLKALCLLYQHHLNNPDANQSLFKPFKKLFKHAGRLRDNHQLEKHLKHYFSEENELINDLHEHLSYERHELKKKFIEKIDNYNGAEALGTLNKLADYIEDPTTIDTLNKDLKVFSINKLNIQDKLLHGPDKEQLHHIRAQLKHVLLLRKLFHRTSADKTTVEHIDHLQEELGKLHDYELLYKFVTKHIEEAEQDLELRHRILNLNIFIEKLRIDCLKKLSILNTNSLV
nr:CHAD domain-containing protein [Solitalea agri]